MAFAEGDHPFLLPYLWYKAILPSVQEIEDKTPFLPQRGTRRQRKPKGSLAKKGYSQAIK